MQGPSGGLTIPPCIKHSHLVAEANVHLTAEGKAQWAPKQWQHHTVFYEHVRRAAEEALEAAKQCPSREEIQNRLSRAYRMLVNCIEKEYAIRNDSDLNPKRHRRGEKLTLEETEVGDVRRHDFSSCAKALHWVLKSIGEIRFYVWQNNIDMALKVFLDTFENEPQWGQNFPKGGTVHSAINRARKGVKQLIDAHSEEAGSGVVDEAEQNLEEICAGISTRAQEMEDKEAREKAKGWHDWVKALEGGAKQAHKWINGPKGWAPQYGTGSTAESTDPDDVMQAIVNKCKKAWWKQADSQGYCSHTLPPHQRTALPRLTPEQISQAGKASARHKAIAYDGMHPRHYANASVQARECFAVIWEACELSGVFPEQAADVQAPLIPKKTPEDGLRDLCLFTGFYRVGMKARQEYCKEWEAKNDAPFLAAAKGRSASDAVWRAAIKTEAAVNRGKAAVVITQDMKSFFQMIDHELLMKRAEETQFPACLLRLAR